MSWPFTEYPPVTPEQLNEGLLDFEDALYDLSEHPPGNSKVLTAFSAAAIELLHDTERPEFKAMSQEYITDRPDMNAAYKVQLLWRGFQYFWVKDNIGYPYNFTTQEILEEKIQAVLTTQPQKDALQENLSYRHNQTNEPRRYAGPKLALNLYKDLLPEPFSLVDVGCSAGLGQVQIERGLSFADFRIEANPHIRKFIRHRLAGKLALSTNVGFDKFPVADISWVEACSYYPEELIGGQKQAVRARLYNTLSGMHKKERFSLLWGDILDAGELNLDDVRAHVPGGVYDASMAVTTLYEVRPDQTRAALANLEALAGKLAIVQDYAEIDPDDPRSLVFAEDIYAPDAHYNLFAKPLVEQGEPWYHLGTWNTGRARKFAPAELIQDLYEKAQAAQARHFVS